MHCRLKVTSQLNAEVWEALLKDYWDQQLVQLIHYGFPLDFDLESPLAQEGLNHNSALAYPDDIDAYLKEEIKYAAILGPFESPPLSNMHHSPFMTCEKPGAPHRRVIIDLSYPRGQSINAGVAKDVYLGTPFILTLPTIDTVTNAVKKWGRGCQIYKFDISRAFRHVKLDPIDYNLLGLRHDAYFADTCLPFGYRNGSVTFQGLSGAIRYIMTQRNYDVINYIDDVIGVGLPSVTPTAYAYLQDVVHRLGFEISVGFTLYMCQLSWDSGRYRTLYHLGSRGETGGNTAALQGTPVIAGALVVYSQVRQCVTCLTKQNAQLIASNGGSN